MRIPVTRRDFIARVAQKGGYAAAFSTMLELGLLADPGEERFQGLPKNSGSGKKVVILGAGIAGLAAAYELRKGGFECTLLEARDRPGGRNWTIRKGSTIGFSDGAVQHCDWKDGLYMNAGPARIPSIHRNLLRYCEELDVALEVEINTSRSALMQSDNLNGGRPVEQRQVVYDTRGHLAELFSKAIHQGSLDAALSKEDCERLLDFLRLYGDLKDDFSYAGSERGGYDASRGGISGRPEFRQPLKFHDLLLANLTKGEFYEDRLDWQATMLQPVGGMDRIPYRFAEKLGGIINYRCAVKEIRKTQNGTRVVYTSADGASHSVAADFCICTLPLPILRDLPGDFSNATRQAFHGMPMVSQYKIAWQSPRFWEREFNIYGGISFLNQTVDLLWYPSDRLFSSHGIVIGGYNLETDLSGVPTDFGRLGSTAEKLAASKASVEKLHPGYSKLLTKPVYVSWPKIPYSLGSFAYNNLESSQAAYEQLLQPDGHIFFAGDHLSRLVSWQEGAVLSAHRVVAAIHDRVRAQA